jgi:hypothetical protein
LTRWITAPELFDPPAAETIQWLNLSRIAKIYSVGPWELANVPNFWLSLGELDIDWQNAMSEKMHRKYGGR